MKSAIEIVSPRPYQVFQRSEQDATDIVLSGMADTDTVEFRLSGGDWQTATARDSKFKGVIENLRVGGPYTVEVRGSGKLKRIPGILVGDLWLLAGQSNMDGCGALVDLEPPHKMVHCFYYDESWGIAKDPLCLLRESIDPVHQMTDDPEELEKARHCERAFAERGAGLGVRFGKDMYKATGIPVGLLMCSHGGTTLAQWDPALKGEGGKSLYGSMLRRVREAGGNVKGCLWYQGESDAITPPAHGANYRADFRNFIDNLRQDLHAPRLPIIYAQLAVHHTWNAVPEEIEGWDKVQADQLAIEDEVGNTAMVSTIGMTISDPIHLDSRSLRILGSQMALIAQRMCFGKDVQVGPRPVRIFFSDDRRTRLVVEYDRCNGSLQPRIGVMGFTLWDGETPLEIVKRERSKDNPCSVALSLAAPAPKGSKLWYGRGLYPVCNLKDSRGFAAPVFGPVAV